MLLVHFLLLALSKRRRRRHGKAAVGTMKEDCVVGKVCLGVDSLLVTKNKSGGAPRLYSFCYWIVTTPSCSMYSTESFSLRASRPQDQRTFQAFQASNYQATIKESRTIHTKGSWWKGGRKAGQNFAVLVHDLCALGHGQALHLVQGLACILLQHHDETLRRHGKFFFRGDLHDHTSMVEDGGLCERLHRLVAEHGDNFDPVKPCIPCVPFLFGNTCIGLVPAHHWDRLCSLSVHLPLVLDSDQNNATPVIRFERTLEAIGDPTEGCNRRTAVVEALLQELRTRHLNAFPCLKKWRNERYPVQASIGTPPCFLIERCGVGLFGLVGQGVHLNGVIEGVTVANASALQHLAKLPEPVRERWLRSGGGMWIGVRSPTKDFFPDHFDQLVAGGLSNGLSPFDCLVKECSEEADCGEAALKAHAAHRLVSAGTITYWNWLPALGLYPERQFIFDWNMGDVATCFEPRNADGEVSAFHAMAHPDILDHVLAGRFKPNCAMVVIDYWLRHGFLDPSEPHYSALLESLHRPLWPRF